jgi:hypothetical protein
LRWGLPTGIKHGAVELIVAARTRQPPLKVCEAMLQRSLVGGLEVSGTKRRRTAAGGSAAAASKQWIGHI